MFPHEMGAINATPILKIAIFEVLMWRKGMQEFFFYIK
jgi:hypothetical protein